MFNRQRAFDMRTGYRSRYNAMIDSREPEDKANAEACRIASDAWEFLSLHFNRILDTQYEANNLPDRVESPTQEQMVDFLAHDMTQRWDEYCQTGIPRNEVQELADNLKDNFQEFVKIQRDMALKNADTIARGTPNAVLATPDVSQASQKGKKGKPNGLQEIPKESPVTPASRPTKINEYIISFIQEGAMKEIIKEMYEELSIDQSPELPEEVDGPESVELESLKG